MNQTGVAEGSPCNEQRHAPDDVIDHLPVNERPHRVRFSLAVYVNADDQRVRFEGDATSRGETGFVHRQRCGLWE